MLATIALAYTLHVVSAWPTRDASTCVRQTSKPPIVSLARNGSLAVLTSGIYSQSILVQRADGARLRVKLPPRKTLASIFNSSAGQFGSDSFPSVWFRGVALAADGTLFASIENEVSGAVTSGELASFEWLRGAWTKLSFEPAMPVDNDGLPVGIAVAAVDTPRHVAFNGQYGRRFPPAMSDLEDPNFLNDRAEYLDGLQLVPLGIGTATAIRGTTVAGFQAGLNAVATSCSNPRRTYAVEWLRGAPEVLLGNGIAYDLNARNEVVGDNEVVFGTPGQPEVWRNGKAVVLDRGPGTAYAIADDGTIVGETRKRAFILDGRSPKSGVHFLDAKIRERGWHIVSAFGIAQTGRILAVAKKDNAVPELVILDPAH